MQTRERNWVDYLIITLIGTPLASGVVLGIAYSRETARLNTCENNLRQVGIHMVVFSERAASENYCSGAFSFRADGCPDVKGWVGDIISIGAAGDIKMCPSNPLRGNECLNELAGFTEVPGQTFTSLHEGVKLASVTTGFCKPFVVEDALGYANNNGTMQPGSQERLDVIYESISQGFNTNYSQSWFAARENVRIVNGVMNASEKYCKGNQTNLSGGLPGAQVRVLEKSFIATNNIPLMGDGAFSQNEIRAEVNLHATILQGAKLVQSFGRGPVEYNPNTQTFDLMSDIAIEKNKITIKDLLKNDVLPLPDKLGYGGVDIDQSGDPDILSFAPNSYGGDDGRLILQDMRNFASVHTHNMRRVGNFLMADGSVKCVEDLNKDGYFNPGFNIQPNKSATPVNIRYNEPQCEVGPAEVFAGPLINISVIKHSRCWEAI